MGALGLCFLSVCFCSSFNFRFSQKKKWKFYYFVSMFLSYSRYDPDQDPDLDPDLDTGKQNL